jgi:CubicO group peptidase (beta-lactamase class C family)
LTPGGLYYGLQNFNPWPPGEREDYCNVGAALAGYLVERIADAAGLGSSFEDYCQDSLFAPLSMDHTSWFLANLDSSNVAVPYRWAGSRHVRYPYYGTPFYPAMQLRTSTLQFARFLAAFLQCGEIGDVRILDCPTVELMTTVQNPEVSPMWGLFWQRVHDGGRWLWGHDGSYLGCKTAMAYCPDENSGVVVLTNGESTAHFNIAHEIFEYVAAVTVSSSLADDSHAMPVTLALDQNHPNPFNPVTTIPYELSTTGEVTLRVYNIHGRLVRSLLEQQRHDAGRYAVRWEGQDDRGRPVASGIYVYRLEVGDQTMSRALVLAR